MTNVVTVSVSSILTLQLNYKIMYETLEHWKQYKQEKALQAKIAKEFKLNISMKKMIIVLLATIMLTSCASTQYNCAAYASAETSK